MKRTVSLNAKTDIPESQKIEEDKDYLDEEEENSLDVKLKKQKKE